MIGKKAAILTSVAAAASLWTPGAAGAKPAEAASAVTPKVVQAINDCRKLADPGARLACYDAAAGALDTAQTRGDVVVIDREQVRAVRRQAFGLQLPSLNLFPHAAKDEPMENLTLTLDHAGRAGDGNWAMTSEENAIWVQTDGAEIFTPPHKGSKLAIRRGALGSFFCKVDGQSAVRCKRET